MENFLTFISKIKAAKIIAPEVDFSDYIPIDLSESNDYLKSQNLQTANDYEVFIQNFLEKNSAKIAYGGYKEVRNLYKRSTVFKNPEAEDRNIHIGLDLWINQTASIHSVLDGIVHSFQNNDALGDYGPTIILAHNINGFAFYTLYGHLSLESLENKFVGQKITQGSQIATLGLPPINGDYAPHLHFQIILNLENKTGDYPGVCTTKDLDFYAKNCPDPNLLLKIAK